ncbi:MAG: MgtC/SapB family protein [Lachnospiraceae bacterium]|nr:MgtC/SapB family protein [Lachnospiraceae bacterium]
MIQALDPLREFSMGSLVFRLVLALICGGMLGLERGRKRLPAGFRTYIVVCLGAALTMILSQYITEMLRGPWAEEAAAYGYKLDFSRLSAMVISGIGFLGAGTIIVTARSEVKGLTTAACLWASACMGLAVGCGFYECAFISIILIIITIRFLAKAEISIIKRSPNMNVYVEFESLEAVGRIITDMKKMGIQIYNVDIERGTFKQGVFPSAVFYTKIVDSRTHSEIMASVSTIDKVITVLEL